jgi:hypothetical protein
MNEFQLTALVLRAQRVETFYKKMEEICPVPPMADEQVKVMNEALGLVKTADYRPYCLAKGCTEMPRMYRIEKGFKCWCCQNEIGFDLKRI